MMVIEDERRNAEQYKDQVSGRPHVCVRCILTHRFVVFVSSSGETVLMLVKTSWCTPACEDAARCSHHSSLQHSLPSAEKNTFSVDILHHPIQSVRCWVVAERAVVGSMLWSCYLGIPSQDVHQLKLCHRMACRPMQQLLAVYMASSMAPLLPVTICHTDCQKSLDLSFRLLCSLSDLIFFFLFWRS